jgi:hypothetical protein
VRRRHRKVAEANPEPVRFRIASRLTNHDSWFQHRVEPEGTDIEVAELNCTNIADKSIGDGVWSVPEWKERTYVVQSSVDGMKTWQTQRCVKGDQV